jgi:hypothetical protein
MAFVDIRAVNEQGTVLWDGQTMSELQYGDPGSPLDITTLWKL